MQYLICFLEGIITFISPCLLPMLPVYITYFAGGGERNNVKTLTNAIGFVLGFTTVFVILGAMAGSFGSVLKSHQTLVNIISGIIIVIFGLSYMGLFRISFFKGRSKGVKLDNLGFITSYIFGAAFSVGWTPCGGVFLGAALVLASQQGTAFSGLVMLLCYSAGLGVPFIVSAVLIDNLKSAFGFIKSNYRIINTVCGLFLVLVGLLTATGYMGRFIALFA